MKTLDMAFLEDKIQGQVSLDRAGLEKFIGYSQGQVPKVIAKKIDKVCAMEGLVLPKIYLRKLQTDLNEDDCKLYKKVEAMGLCNGGDQGPGIYAFVYTLGPALEEQVVNFSEGNEMMNSLILDKVGVVRLDAINQALRDMVEEIERPYKVTRDLYPGDKGFGVIYQRWIYDCFEGIESTISINDNHILSPLKSVSGLMILGRTCQEISRCDRCGMACGKGADT